MDSSLDLFRRPITAHESACRKNVIFHGFFHFAAIGSRPEVDATVQGKDVEEVSMYTIGRTDGQVAHIPFAVDPFDAFIGIFFNAIAGQDVIQYPMCDGAGWGIGIFRDDHHAMGTFRHIIDDKGGADPFCLAGIFGGYQAVLYEFRA